ncbi:MAG: hypothetical protein HC828_18795 [Blastochloris sp.]|nr:hypothetical protein [Blastochloris sp.]
MSREIRDYDQIIAALFHELHQQHPDASLLPFVKRDVERFAQTFLGRVPQNLPDVIYTYRTGRAPLPDTILAQGHWSIQGVGKGRYTFVRLARPPYVDIPLDLEIINILDATPQIVIKYQSRDEQGMLARIRYNRLVDIFTATTTYHLQSHFRTTIAGVGQIEIDDLYIGVDTEGVGYIIPY